MNTRRLRRLSHRRAQVGLSLVELMVGITVGLFVLGGATLLVMTQLGDNRRLLLETQLQQDLRATMDIMTRELRRAGRTEVAAANVWSDGSSGATPNALAAVTIADGGHEVSFRYNRSAGVAGPYGFKWESNRIKSYIGNGWQDLTDANVMRVTAFDVVLDNVITEVIPCPRACSADPADIACWPTLTVRNYTISLVAQAVNDASVRRSQSARIRVRNDLLGFNIAAQPTVLCPA